jgi:hypothetical protein
LHARLVADVHFDHRCGKLNQALRQLAGDTGVRMELRFPRFVRLPQIAEVVQIDARVECVFELHVAFDRALVVTRKEAVRRQRQARLAARCIGPNRL